MDYDLFFGWVSVIFFSLSLAVVMHAGIKNKVSWNRLKKRGYSKRTEATNDFMEENKRLVDLVEERLEYEANVFSGGNKKDVPTIQELRDSSEIASLSRYAHFGGVYITVEQIPADGEDPDEGDPDVFKTDMARASENRERRRMELYRR